MDTNMAAGFLTLLHTCAVLFINWYENLNAFSKQTHRQLRMLWVYSVCVCVCETVEMQPYLDRQRNWKHVGSDACRALGSPGASVLYR